MPRGRRSKPLDTAGWVGEYITQPQRVVLDARAEGWSVLEIARALGISRQAVKDRISRARRVQRDWAGIMEKSDVGTGADIR